MESGKFIICVGTIEIEHSLVPIGDTAHFEVWVRASATDPRIDFERDCVEMFSHRVGVPSRGVTRPAIGTLAIDPAGNSSSFFEDAVEINVEDTGPVVPVGSVVQLDRVR